MEKKHHVWDLFMNEIRIGTCTGLLENYFATCPCHLPFTKTLKYEECPSFNSSVLVLLYNLASTCNK